MLTDRSKVSAADPFVPVGFGAMVRIGFTATTPAPPFTWSPYVPGRQLAMSPVYTAAIWRTVDVVVEPTPKLIWHVGLVGSVRGWKDTTG